jgi:Flp pilus assembly protein TadD
MAAMILQVQNRSEEARVRYQKILELDSNAAVAANNLAYMDAESNTDLNVALQLAQTAKARLPDDPDVSDTLGWVYVRKGLGALGAPHLEYSVGKDPKNPLYQYHLGLAYAGAGNKVKARATLEQALKLNGNFGGAADARKALDTLRK